MPTTRVSRTKMAEAEVESDAGGRDPMPEPTFLQIQGRGDSTMRMIELPTSLVRIGRGPHCEVRLNDPGLGDVQCMLRRRGSTWHFQPVGPAGQVWFDGRAVDQQRPIPLGVPFRVGQHWLVLRPADSATNDWGSFDAPITIEARADDPPSPASTPEEPASPPGATQSRPSDDNEERLRRWEARLEQRERWLKDRQEERRWEARWKSAGESIRSRSTPPAAKAPAPPRTASPRPTPTPTPTAPPASNVSMPTRPLQTPPVARIIEPKGREPIRRVADPTPRPSAPRVVVRPLPDPPSTTRKAVAPPTIRVEVPPRPPMSRSLVTLVPPSIPVVVVPEPPVRPGNPGPPTPIEPVEVIGRTSGVLDADASVSTVPEEGTFLESGMADLAGASLLPAREGEGGSPSLDEAAGPIEAPALIESSEWLDEVLPVAIEEARHGEIAPRPAEPVLTEPEATAPALPDSSTAEMPGLVGLARGEWPSARAIFAAQGRRARPEPEVPQTRRRKATEAEPTEILGPACWFLPLWAGWFPVLVVSVMLGLGGVALAYEWAVEANAANVAMRLAMRPEGTAGATIDPTLIPRGGWWTSTAPHLSAWAMALIRAGDGQDHSEDIRSLLDASKNVSRLASRSRFVIDPPDAPAEPGSPPDLSHLGRTRDVVTLVRTGQTLRKQGKVESAIRAYREAMELASKANLRDLDPPTFFEDPQVRRYAMPREALLGFVVRFMAEDGEWTREQWAEALPPTATASLAASRVFARMQKRGEADRLADLAIRQAEASTPPGYDPAEDRAAGAEALACRGRWTDSAEQYRRAIDQAEDDATRRMWWLNLAEVAQRVGDDSGRIRAIEAAKAPASVDEVTRRALRYQQSLPGLASTSPRP